MTKVKRFFRNVFVFALVPVAVVAALELLTGCDDIDCCWPHKPCGEDVYLAQECGKSTFVPIPVPVPVPVPVDDDKEPKPCKDAGVDSGDDSGNGNGSGSGSGSHPDDDCEPVKWEHIGQCVSSCVHDSDYGRGKGKRCVGECRDYYCEEE